MNEERNMFFVILGYMMAILLPLIGLVYGFGLFYFKRDNEYYNKHSRFIMILAIVVWAISLAFALVFGWI